MKIIHTPEELSEPRFPKVLRLEIQKKLFNTRLDSNTVRAIDIRENDSIKDAALKNLIREAVSLNRSRAKFD
jgi:hypothetical protein